MSKRAAGRARGRNTMAKIAAILLILVLMQAPPTWQRGVVAAEAYRYGDYVHTAWRGQLSKVVDESSRKQLHLELPRIFLYERMSSVTKNITAEDRRN